MILPYQELNSRHSDLIEHPDKELLNPASIDIRIGDTLLIEVYNPSLPLWFNRLLRPISFLLPKNVLPKFHNVNLKKYSKKNSFYIYPGECVLVASQENLLVPDDLVMDIRLKSSRARELYNHSLAFWFDPGWMGIGTLELQNIGSYCKLPLYPGMKIGQIIYNKLTDTCEKPYRGRYRGAGGVESSKA